MKLRKIQLDLLSRFIAKGIKAANIAAASVGEDAIQARVKELIEENINEEKRLEEDALKLLEKHKRSVGVEFDEAKALLMIKKQLAKERNFVL